MTDNKVALLRFPAFIIDITLVMLPLYVLGRVDLCGLKFVQSRGD